MKLETGFIITHEFQLKLSSNIKIELVSAKTALHFSIIIFE